MNYKAVVFDMDGVIFDSERVVQEEWYQLFAELGIPDLEKIYYKCLGVNTAATKQIFWDYYGADFPVDTYKEEVSRRFHEKYGDGKLPLKPGVRELLSFLNEKGILVGLATSTRYQVAEQEIRDAGILPFFTNLTCGDMVSKSKPEPDIFLKACENLCIHPEEAIAVEDSYNGIRSASRAGLTPIMVPDLMAPNEEMQELAAHIFGNLLEVRDWLKTM